MKRSKDRNGFTLRELMLAMAMGSSIFFAAIGAVHHAMDWSTLSRHRTADDRTYARLADQLRDDLHRARAATVEAEGTMLRIVDAGIQYSIDGTTVERSEASRTIDSRATDREPTRRETYRFEQRVAVQFREEQSTGQFGFRVRLIPESHPTRQWATENPLLYAMKASLGLRRLYERGEIR